MALHSRLLMAIGFVTVWLTDILIASSMLSAFLVIWRLFAWLGRNKEADPRSRSKGWLLLLALGVFTVLLAVQIFQTRANLRTGDRVVDAVTHYCSTNGRPPEDLDDLVPGSLDKVPTVRVGLSSKHFRYVALTDGTPTNDDGCSFMLWFSTGLPFLAWIYDPVSLTWQPWS